MQHKTKVVLSKFLVDRIHKDWIDKLYPQDWMLEKAKDKGVKDRG